MNDDLNVKILWLGERERASTSEGIKKSVEEGKGKQRTNEK